MNDHRLIQLHATAWVRSMSPGTEGGGSQPHVFETEQGPYMVKVSNNPQGPRVLVNELIAGLCLDWLDVHHPAPAVVHVADELIKASPGARFGSGVELQSGPAFGSELWQSDPQGTVDPSLIRNNPDVAGTLAMDTWLGQNDSRQYRVRASPEEPGKYDFIPVDHGHSIGSPGWTTADLTARTNPVLAASPIPVNRQHLEHAIQRLRDFTADDARAIVSQIPPEWLVDDERLALETYLSNRAASAADVLQTAYPVAGEAAA